MISVNWAILDGVGVTHIVTGVHGEVLGVHDIVDGPN